MKVELIMNGTIKLVLIPENDLEKLGLELLTKSEIESTEMKGANQILDKVVHDAMIIQPKKEKVGDKI
jgi:hypothetical protein